MHKNSPVKFSNYFSLVTDPRIVGRSDHKLIDIITVALCAIISGADNWPEIGAYGKAKYEWIKEFLELPCGIPTHHTFGRFFIAVSTIDAMGTQTKIAETIIGKGADYVCALKGNQGNLNDKVTSF